MTGQDPEWQLEQTSDLSTLLAESDFFFFLIFLAEIRVGIFLLWKRRVKINTEKEYKIKEGR